MQFLVPFSLAGADLISLAIMLVLVGLGAGFIAGLLGVGGGLLFVPMLYFLFGIFEVAEHLRVQLAVGTSLSVVVLLSFRAACSHAARKAVDFELLRHWAPAIISGALVGSLISGWTLGALAALVFVGVALTAAVQMAFTKEGTHLGDTLPQGAFAHALAGSIAAISASAGIAGGTLIVPTLTLCSYPLRRAIATSSAFGTIIAAAGLTGFAISGWGVADRPPVSIGYVSVPAFLVIASTSLTMVPLGVRAAHRINPTRLRRVFAAVLVVTAGRMLYEIAA